MAEETEMEPQGVTSSAHSGGGRPARTLLEQLIRVERGESFEEFTAYAEEFARRHRLQGTLSLRHLLRLVSGRKADGSPLGTPRPATASLLERIFGVPIAELLAPPRNVTGDYESAELRQRLNAARHVDRALIDLFREQLDSLRRLDRQMGAIVAYDEVKTKAAQISTLQTYSLSPSIRAGLAALLAELNALAGWESLDRSALRQAWDHHERAKIAAQDADSPILFAHALAQQAVVLNDLGETELAVEQLVHARNLAERTAPALLRAWLAAAHGEGLAVAGRRSEALQAFDTAAALLPRNPVDQELPFLFLGGAHLDRWRGHALARLGADEAVGILYGTLQRLDPSFVRAETSLRVDLAAALIVTGERHTARSQALRAEVLASEIGSVRQQRRARALLDGQPR